MIKITRLIVFTFLTLIFLLLVMYGYVSNKRTQMWEDMQNPENFSPERTEMDYHTFSVKEKRFCDSMRGLKFETVILEKTAGNKNYSMVLSYNRNRPFKPFFPDSSERFKLAIAQTFYCNYLNTHRKPELHSIFVKDLDFSIPETEYSISELEMGCLE